MVGWATDWSVDTNVDWALLVNVQDLQKAVNERSNALGDGDAIAVLKAVGDDVQDHAWINEMQTWIENNLTSFLVLRDAGYYDAGGASGGTVDPATDTYSTLQELFADAGLATNQFRRYTTHPDDAGLDLGAADGNNGKIQAGDVIGPWLFEDIQAVLNVLVLTLESVTWTADSETNRKEGKNSGDTAWADATKSAEADWSGSPNTATENLAPVGMVRGYKYGSFYYAYERRRYSYGETSGMYAGVKRTLEWYGYIQDPTGLDYGTADTVSYAAYGDGFTENRWTLWGTDTPASPSASEVSVSSLGHTSSQPVDDGTWCAEPGADEDIQKGWEATDKIAVVRWGVVGGFTYY